MGSVAGRKGSLEGTWKSTPVFLPGESMDRGAWQAIVHRWQRFKHD